MRAVIEITPTSNYSVASPADRSDQMEALARILMGLSHPVQLIGQTRPIADSFDWAMPPSLTRRWLAVVTADNEATLEWRARTLKKSLEGIGLNCVDVDEPGTPTLHEITPDGVRTDDGWAATLVLRRWPREVAPGWLGQALAGDLPVDVAIHVQPQDAQKIARFLKRQQAWQSDDSDAGSELGRDDAERVRKNLIARIDKPCKVAIVLTVRAPDHGSLRPRVETLQHEIGLALADARLAKFEQDRGIEATSATGTCKVVGAWRTLDCTSVASTWIFQPATILHKTGAEIGTTHEGGMLVQLDPFAKPLRSFGGLLTGSVGSGKSYFLKLLLRRLRGVEIRIVEHSDPPEYDGVPGLLTFSVADLSLEQQIEAIRTYLDDLWDLARRDPKPRLLVLDELWSVLRHPRLADLVEEIARRGRKYGLALWIATQQVEELLESGKAVFDNAAIRIYLQQENRDLEGLCKAAHLPEPARKLLRGAARGQALIDCGRMLVLVDVQATPEEHTLITTDPREMWANTEPEVVAA